MAVLAIISSSGVNASRAFVNFAGRVTNSGNAPITLTIHMTVLSSGQKLGSETALPAIVTVQPGGSASFVLSQLVNDTDPPGVLSATAWATDNNGAQIGDKILSGALATIEQLESLSLNGGFPQERQVRYIGGVDGPARDVYMILSAYVEPLNQPGALNLIRQIRSGNFRVPTVQVPTDIVSVYNTDPPGMLAGGIKLFNVQTDQLMPTDFGNERLGLRLWGLNIGQISARVSGNAGNFYGRIQYGFNTVLINTGDVDMSVRLRTAVEARQSETDFNFGEIPGSIVQFNLDVPKGGSYQIAGPNLSPYYPSDPWYGYIAYGNYIRVTMRIEALTPGIVPPLMSWNVGYGSGITI